MYRLLVYCNNNWKWGIRKYKTLSEAKKRVIELNKFGIMAEVKPTEELFT